MADDYHYKNLLIGTKAIGLGGAFTAISDDLSAVFYNPAGLTNTETSNSASISTFAWERSSFEGVFSNGDDLTRSSFSIVPSFLGFGSNQGSWQWGIGFGVSDLATERNYDSASYTLFNEQNISYGTQTEFANIDLDNTLMELATAVARKITPQFSIGASLNIKYKIFEAIQGSGINSEITTPVGSVYAGFNASRRWRDEIIIVSPILGLLYETDAVNIGLKYAKDIALERSFKASHNIFVSSPTPLPPGSKPASTGTIHGNKLQPYSSQWTLGLAKRIHDFEWSMDIDHYTEVNVEEFYLADILPAITRDIKEVTNLSIGLTFYQSTNKYFRFGVFTDKANDEINTQLPFQRTEVIDLLGFSMDYTTDAFGVPFSIGAYYKYGTGEVRVADIRAVENLVGLELYPKNNDFDTTSATKELIVVFISANF